jgi:hypothetical protein
MECNVRRVYAAFTKLIFSSLEIIYYYEFTKLLVELLISLMIS